MTDARDGVLQDQAADLPVMYDALTGLPSRNLLLDRLQQAVVAARRDNASLGLLLVSLDRFEEVNTTLGPEYGNLLLKQVTARLRSTLRESDNVGRMEGAVFALLLPRADELGATLAARKVFVALEQPYVLDGQEVVVRASIGIALYPQHGRDAEALRYQAQIALQTAEREKSGYAVFGSGSRDGHRPRHVALTDELRQAIEYGELLLTYQPKLDLRTQLASSVEALLYWEHPRQGFIAPEQFIPLAEHSGLIKQLNLWVLNEALRQCRSWLDDGVELGVAVNVSPRSLHDPQLVETVQRALTAHNVPAHRLEIEVAESTVMADPLRALKVLGELEAMGIRLLVDDFGTSFSSLVHLVQLPTQQLKIDRSFVSSMTVNRDDARIVKAIIDLGHNLDLEVAAVGVETHETLDALRGLGCDLAQGYLVSQPLPPEQVAPWAHEAAQHASRGEALSSS